MFPDSDYHFKIFALGKYYYNYNDIKFKEGEALDSPAGKEEE